MSWIISKSRRLILWKWVVFIAIQFRYSFCARIVNGTVEKVKEMLGDMVAESFECDKELQKAEGYIKLECGFAMIPLLDIELPFYSHYLWVGMMPLWACTSPFKCDCATLTVCVDFLEKTNPTLPNPNMLIEKYILNFVAKPFNITKECIQPIYDQTSSPMYWDSGSKRTGHRLTRHKSLPTLSSSSCFPTSLPCQCTGLERKVTFSPSTTLNVSSSLIHHLFSLVWQRGLNEIRG